MAAMGGGVTQGQPHPPQLQQQQQPPPQQPPQQPAVEALNAAVQQQLNLEHVKIRAISLFKAISRILEDFDAYARTNTTPKWQDILGQYSMVNLELFNIVDEIRKVSKAFVVHPKNVNAENSTILPVMLSSKLLPEMEIDDNSKKEQLLQGLQNLPVASQIEKLKARIDMIAAACESAEKVLSDTRKAYGFGTRQGPTITPTLDKAQAAKIQEQENLLRAAVNHGEGLRVSGDQRQITPDLPMHLVDVLHVGDGMQNVVDASGKNSMYQRNTPLQSNTLTAQNALLQATGAQLMGRSAASPSAGTSFDNTTASPLPYANSPRSGTNMNTPSPQQQSQQQQQQHHQHQLLQQQQQQQRPKMMPLSQHPQQLLTQQQFRQSAMPGLGQLHGQPQMQQFSQALGTHQQFQGRQMASGIGQSQLGQGNPMTRHLSQFSSAANSALFNAAQTTQNTQMIPNMSGTMPSQSLLQSRMQRTHPSQLLNDQMFNMGGANPTGMLPIQQQGTSQSAFGNMQQPNAQSLQANMVALQNNPQNHHPNFSQQRPQNQQ
ncbi:mediator of RNA polymerase II transcription subunit 8 isoform X1 [Punica granatum]|uniref:Mediator of RNA polymerase II transcription subunit 8 isoform X1 n=1 Tax=Punica granatum TaxID=22663 RepID=A0A6P8DUD8_PUNGR|nr:mediator of RNA polymerase II transcription subunit 8 isoform X1 [Punica granatum]XP_031399471.1 mediator of RNA polymerase II transcription subunit 8 isoform X1 [Punica granatum]